MVCGCRPIEEDKAGVAQESPHPLLEREGLEHSGGRALQSALHMKGHCNLTL